MRQRDRNPRGLLSGVSARFACVATIFIGILFFPHNFARSYDGLMIGAILAIALSGSGRSGIMNALGSIPDAVVFLLLAITFLLNGYSNDFVLLFSGAVALLIATLVLRGGILRRALENPALVFIGRRSYAMYLIHVLMLDVVDKFAPAAMTGNGILTVFISYGLTLAAASVMYVLIERPAISLGRRLSNRIAERELNPPVRAQ